MFLIAYRAHVDVFLNSLLARIPTSGLREKVSSLASRRREIIGALDLLFMGL